MTDQAPQWTDAQRAAVTTEDVGLLVAASAGTGKTFVLSQRCAHLVTDARRHCQIDQLLVVTFTEAAAAEMRSRIADALRRRLDSNPTDSRLRRQLALIDIASISTIHAFCLDLLRQNFSLAGIDPNVAVLDAEEADLLKLDTLEAVFKTLYRTEPDDPTDGDLAQQFRRLVELYGQGNDRSISQWVLAIHALLASLVDPDRWLADAVDLAAVESATRDAMLHDQIVSDLRRVAEHARAEADYIRLKLSEWTVYADALDDIATSATVWLDQIEADPAAIDDVRRKLIAYEPPKVATTRMSKTTPDDVRDARDRAKDAFAQIVKTDLSKLCNVHAAGTAERVAADARRTGPFVEALVQLVRRFDQQYRHAKQRLAVLDFDDLQQRCLDLLTDDRATLAPTPLSRQLQQRYQHVLVDEYQDINPVQDAILTLVSRQDRPDQPNNLFTVGDVKQSIYGFRLAAPELFLDRQRQAGATPDVSRIQQIALKENFRSRAGVLDTVNALFDRLMTDSFAGAAYDTRAALVAGMTRPATEHDHTLDRPATELHILPQARHTANNDETDDEGMPEVIEREAHLVGQRILELTGRGDQPHSTIQEKTPNGTWTERPVRCRDIVILLRTVAHTADRFATVLRQMGIPVFADTTSGYFGVTEVRDMLNVLAILDNQQQDIPLAAVMRSPLLDTPFSDGDLVRIRQVDRSIPFHRAIREYTTRGDDDALRARLTAFLDTLAGWRQLARQVPVADLIDALYEQTGYLHYVSGLTDGAQRRANLIELHQRARQFGHFARQGLFRFLRMIENLIERQRDLGQPATLSQAEDVVRIMTTHRSKGLEFPIVIVAQLGRRFNLRDTTATMVLDRARHIGLKVIDDTKYITYPTAMHHLVTGQKTRHALAEEMRIAYVALTRARDHLILVGTRNANGHPDAQRRWADHEGPLSDATLHAATNLIDWIEPALACQPAGCVAWTPHTTPADALVTVHHYDLKDVGHGTAGAATDDATDQDRYDAIAALAPLPDAPPPNAAVRDTIDRLTATYTHDAMTRLPAVISVTELKRRHLITAEPDDPTHALLQSHWSGQRPRFMTAATGPSGSDRGTATHAVMQHIDLTRPCSRDDLADQLVAMVAAGLLTAGQADMVDLDAVAWFFTTDLGQRFLDRAHAVHRERPFVIRLAPNAYDPTLPDSPYSPDDGIVLRGVIDCLLEPLAAPGLPMDVVDYKTDRVSGKQLAERIQTYRPQLHAYTQAVAGIWNRPVAAGWLVFLHPRHIERLDLS